ncbi:MAG: hypothetical protein P9L94_07755 [Candidatus Hinthialibacter antarcticus]|nr:hypothetical protein [Candidatus Hinthialibacter antarcticus]
MKKTLIFLLLSVFILQPLFCADDDGVDVFRLQVRVIFADSTGIRGALPKELGDMGLTLRKYFDYPAFELSNTIRLSTFSDEDAVALVFPDHYLRITPKGKTKDAIKAKLELFYLPQNTAERTRITAGGVDDAPKVRLDSVSRAGRDEPMPIISSAVLVDDRDWEAFGGVPVRYNSQGTLQSNTLSSGGFSTSTEPTGRKRYLILAVRVEK